MLPAIAEFEAEITSTTTTHDNDDATPRCRSCLRGHRKQHLEQDNYLCQMARLAAPAVA